MGDGPYSLSHLFAGYWVWHLLLCHSLIVTRLLKNLHGIWIKVKVICTTSTSLSYPRPISVHCQDIVAITGDRFRCRSCITFEESHTNIYLQDTTLVFILELTPLAIPVHKISTRHWDYLTYNGGRLVSAKLCLHANGPVHSISWSHTLLWVPCGLAWGCKTLSFPCTVRRRYYIGLLKKDLFYWQKKAHKFGSLFCSELASKVFTAITHCISTQKYMLDQWLLTTSDIHRCNHLSWWQNLLRFTNGSLTNSNCNCLTLT